MPKGVKTAREAMVKFRDPADIPPEMRPTGKGADKKGIPVVVLKETATMVTLQYTEPKGRKKQVMQVTANFPANSVVIYNVEAVDVAAAPEAPAAAKASTEAPAKKATRKKRASKKGPSIKSTVITKAIRANKGPMGMGDLSKATGQEAALLRTALAELIEEGVVVKEGAGRGTTYGLVKKGGAKKVGKKKKVAKKKVAKKKVARKKKKAAPAAEEAAPAAKRRKKGKKVKKPRKKLGASRRKKSFILDEDD